MKDYVPISGRVRVVVRDDDGSIVHVEESDNIVVIDGFNAFAALIAAEAISAVSHMAVGDGGGTQPDEDQSDLQGTELARVSTTLTRTDNELEYVSDFSSISGDVDVNEFGLFNDATAGTMFARWVTNTFTLFDSQSMEVSWTIRVGR